MPTSKIRFATLLFLGSVATAAPAAHAVPIAWTDWTAADATSATGNIGAIGVSFTGNISPAAQTAGGTNFWASNPTTYTGPGTDNGPPDSDIIRLTGGGATGTQTVTFSEAVENPVFAILSLGQPGFPVTYEFDAPFDVINSGPGFFGGGPGALTELAGNVLQGTEGHGVIQFFGTFTSISWTIPTAEFWHGFQVGIEGEDNGTVPEPAAMSLLLGGLAALGLARRYRRRG